MASDVALLRNPNNGRFNFQWKGGDVVFDSTCEHEVMSRLVEARAKWWADQNGTHGSRLRDVKYLNSSAKTDAEAYAREALQGMVDAGQIAIKKIVVNTLSPRMGARFTVTVYYSAAGSDKELQASTTFV